MATGQKRRQKRGIAGDKTVCIPIADESRYRKLVEDLEKFREYLDEVIEQHRFDEDPGATDLASRNTSSACEPLKRLGVDLQQPRCFSDV